MSKFEFRVGVHDGLIVVTEPTSHFYAIYAKLPDPPRLVLERRRPTERERARVGVDYIEAAGDQSPF